jgi:hypothetical protein
MIMLNVMPYCHNCPNFEQTLNTYYADSACMHIISCRKADECRCIERHILNVIKEKENA